MYLCIHVEREGEGKRGGGRGGGERGKFPLSYN